VHSRNSILENECLRLKKGYDTQHTKAKQADQLQTEQHLLERALKGAENTSSSLLDRVRNHEAQLEKQTIAHTNKVQRLIWTLKKEST